MRTPALRPRGTARWVRMRLWGLGTCAPQLSVHPWWFPVHLGIRWTHWGLPGRSQKAGTRVGEGLECHLVLISVSLGSAAVFLSVCGSVHPAVTQGMLQWADADPVPAVVHSPNPRALSGCRFQSLGHKVKICLCVHGDQGRLPGGGRARFPKGCDSLSP